MTDSIERTFASVVQPHFVALYRAALRLTRRRADAEDLVQEVCLRACGRLEDLASMANARAWLMRTLYHLFVDTERRRRRSPVSLRSEDAGDLLPSETAGPDSEADVGRMHDRVAAIWDRLEPEQQALLSLHAEGHSLEELAEIFRVNRNALSARLHRARHRLARLLAADEPKASLQLAGIER